MGLSTIRRRLPIAIMLALVLALPLAAFIPTRARALAATRETLTAPFVNGQNGATTTNRYFGSVSVKVSGFGRAAATAYSDAFYVFTNNAGNPIPPEHHFDFGLCINSQPVENYLATIPPYRSSHTYQFTISLGSSPQQIIFGVCDTFTGDNSGSFTITVNGQSQPVIEESDSQFWAGYAAIGAKGSPINFTRVEASWTVQSITCLLGEVSRATYWVGLGGVNAPLEQIGTYSYCLLGIHLYGGIWQIIMDKAQGAQYIDLLAYPVYPDDRMEASVSDFGQGIYLLTMHNITRGWTWTEFHTGSLKKSAVQTAECIVEAPPSSDKKARIYPLSNFGAFTFEGCKADNNSLLTYPRLLQFTLKNGKTVMAEPSDIIGNSDFSVIWIHE